jgi:hypothetical protein
VGIDVDGQAEIAGGADGGGGGAGGGGGGGATLASETLRTRAAAPA